MPIRRYKCKNVAGGCEHAFVKDIFEVADGVEFECPGNLASCEVEEVTGKERGSGSPLWKKVALVGGLIAVMGVGAAMFVRREPTAPPSDPSNPSNPKPSSTAQACDNQTADPADSARRASGVELDDVVPVPAIESCTAAVNESPNVARLQFQLGRALVAGSRAEQAQKSLQTAADMGYCPAKFYLAEILYAQSGSGDGDEQKAALAGQLFHEAKDCGYAPAAARLEELIFEPDDYGNPKVMDALYNAKIDELNDARLLVALYCRGIHDYVSMEFHPASQDCPGKLAQPAITYNLEKAVMGDPRTEAILEGPIYRSLEKLLSLYLGPWLDPIWQGDLEKYRKYFIELGKRDATVMIKKHGCLGDVSRQIYGQVVVFARANRPFVDYADKILPKAKELFGEQLNPTPHAAPAGSIERNYEAGELSLC